MKLLAFAATTSSQSINRRLIGYSARLLSDGLIADVETDIIDLNDYEMPIYSSDRENEGGIPQLAHDFYNKITGSDALLISYAEHNGSYTAAYKNLFDWTSRIDTRVFQDKPTVMLSTSPGPGGAGNVLQAAVNSAPYFGNDLRASLSVPGFGQNFDAETGSLSNAELDGELRTALSKLTNAQLTNEGTP